MGDSNASGGGGAPWNIDADRGFNSPRSLDRDTPALPPGNWLADRGDVVSNSNRCNGNRGNSMAEGNRSNSMADSNWANSCSNRSERSCHGGNRGKGSNSVACRSSSIICRTETSKELGIGVGISISFGIGLRICLTPPASSSDGTKEGSS